MIKNFLISLTLSVVVQVASTQSLSWHGFVQDTFTFHSQPAWIVKPPKPLPGNPWIWRARFPNWHFEMDSILVQKGYHIAFVNLNNQYGSPNAMAIWDKFYEYLILEHHLGLKPVLEGVSRGGLFVHNWAKSNPGKVSCIYAEAPVCDFRSWPGGKGKGKGSPSDWKRLMDVYELGDEDKATKYNDQPIQNLDHLAQLKVPILHVVSLRDSVVPYEENSKVLTENYVQLGGPAVTIPMHNSLRLYGHHFDIPNPKFMADLVHHLTQANTQIPSESYFKIRNGLPGIRKKLGNQDTLCIAFLGGSITYNPGWRNLFMEWLQSTYPKQKFKFIAAGIPSMGSTPHAFRLQRDVLSKGKIDLLILEAAVNDQSNGRTSLEQQLAMEGIVRHTKQSDYEADILMLHFADPQKLAVYGAGDIPEVIRNHDRIANHYQLPSLHLSEEIHDRIQNKEFTWKLDFKNLHPSPYGQRLYYHSLVNIFKHCIDQDHKVDPGLPDPLHPNHYGFGKILSFKSAKLGSGWQVKSKWTPEDIAGTRAGYTQVPMLCSEKPGARLKFTFRGSLIGLAVAAGPDAGIIEYRIDRGPWKKRNLFTKWSKHLHLPWYQVLEASLPPGIHKITIKIAKTSDSRSVGHACRIKHFVVNDGPN